MADKGVEFSDRAEFFTRINDACASRDGG